MALRLLEIPSGGWVDLGFRRESGLGSRLVDFLYGHICGWHIRALGMALAHGWAATAVVPAAPGATLVKTKLRGGGGRPGGAEEEKQWRTIS